MSFIALKMLIAVYFLSSIFRLSDIWSFPSPQLARRFGLYVVLAG
jgi:hypothetical protein